MADYISLYDPLTKAPGAKMGKKGLTEKETKLRPPPSCYGLYFAMTVSWQKPRRQMRLGTVCEETIKGLAPLPEAALTENKSLILL